MGMNIRTKAKIRLNGRWREIISSFKALKTAMTKNKIMKPNISEIIRSDFFIPPAGFSENYNASLSKYFHTDVILSG